MSNIIEITDFNAPELDVYARISEIQLLNRAEPKKGIFIAESPKVIERALKSVISMIFDMIVFSCSVFLFLSVYCSRISLQKKARCYLTPPGFAITYKTVCFFFRSVLPSTGSYPRSLHLYNTHSGSHEKVRRRSSSACLLILLP